MFTFQCTPKLRIWDCFQRQITTALPKCNGHQRQTCIILSDFETVDDEVDNDIYDITDTDDIDNDITGETTTSEKRKMRSATQRAARRWWNTEAIDLQ